MKLVAVLEDTPGRVDAIRRAIGSDLSLVVFSTAPEFVAWLRDATDVALITLDYHLGPREAGTGMDAAVALAGRTPLAPVILHSSDSTGASAQEDVLSAAGWQTERFPFSEAAWTSALARLVQGPRAESAVEGASQDQDRVAVIHDSGALVLVLADGAGGSAGGREAAEAVVRLVRDRAGDLVSNSLSPLELLTIIDAALVGDRAAGEATAVLAVVSGSRVTGASVGDSGAWLLGTRSVRDLTGAQLRKPMMGSGAARPVAFGPIALEGRLLLASDGLLKYASRERIQTAALAQPMEQSVWTLIETVRLPSGNLHDDVSVILCGFD